MLCFSLKAELIRTLLEREPSKRPTAEHVHDSDPMKRLRKKLKKSQACIPVLWYMLFWFILLSKCLVCIILYIPVLAIWYKLACSKFIKSTFRVYNVTVYIVMVELLIMWFTYCHHFCYATCVQHFQWVLCWDRALVLVPHKYKVFLFDCPQN